MAGLSSAVISEEMTMTCDEFKQAGQAFQLRITGKTRGWPGTIAHQIGKSVRTVHRYADGDTEIPALVAEKMQRLIEE